MRRHSTSIEYAALAGLVLLVAACKNTNHYAPPVTAAAGVAGAPAFAARTALPH